MEFKHQMIGSTLLFKYHDPIFNDVGVIQYKRQLAALLEKYTVQDIILDVENVKIIDNTGLSAIMFARRYTKANENTCILAMPRPKLISLLKTARLSDSFQIIDRKDEYQAFLKSLVEHAEQERLEREAEKARKAEEAKKAEEPKTETEQGGTAVPINGNAENPPEKKNNSKRTRRKTQNKPPSPEK
jgi:anti-anti-sigma factor